MFYQTKVGQTKAQHLHFHTVYENLGLKAAHKLCRKGDRCDQCEILKEGQWCNKEGNYEYLYCDRASK